MIAHEDPLVEKALKSSGPEGVLAQVTGSISDHCLAPCALFLGASATQIGWLSAGPKLLNCAVQLASSRAVRLAGGRRRLLIAGALLQGAALLPAALAALLGGRGALLLLFAGAFGYRALGALMHPAWSSLMSEYLPARRRAGFFGRRNRLLAWAGLVALGVWGLLAPDSGAPTAGLAFAALFVGAALSRAASSFFMARLASRPADAAPRRPVPARALLKGQLGGLIAFTAVSAFAAQLGDTVQPVHYLRALGGGFGGYAFVRLAGGLGAALTAAWWGRRADADGPVPSLRAAGLLLAVSPTVWAVTNRPEALAAFELLDGAAAAGFSVCAAAHLYDLVPEGERLEALALQALVVGFSAFVGALAGGALADFGVPLRLLFASAATLRLAADLALGGRLLVQAETPAPPLAEPA